MKTKSKAQSITEYTICLAMVLMALLGMQFYVKRGLQGRYADLADDSIVSIKDTIANDPDLSQEAKEKMSVTFQYEPAYRQDNIENYSDLDVAEVMEAKGKINRDISIEDTVKPGSTLTETIDCYEDK